MLDLSQPRLMGILNVTPDSFSDGGQFAHRDAAVAQALSLVEQGADILDIGGESTRPGSQRVPASEQKNRVCGVIEDLVAQKINVPISIDTTQSEVAQEALSLGAGMINDISGARDDPLILEVASAKNVPLCLMHMQGIPENMQDEPKYDNVVEEVCSFLSERVKLALKCGVKKENIIVDPGIGFGKTTEHNLQLIKNLNEVVRLGWPVLLGASRKRFMGRICRETDPKKRKPASCATTVLGVQAGVSIFRVHDIWEHRQVLDLMKALQ